MVIVTWNHEQRIQALGGIVKETEKLKLTQTISYETSR
jgi:hypothetical protein